jgi:hypothetical protein
MLDVSLRENQALELTRLARSIRDAAEAIGEAMDELAALAPSLPREESIDADNNSLSLLELGVGAQVLADSLEEAAASLSARFADDAGAGDGGGVRDE